MVTEEGRVKILDVGLAKLTETEQSDATLTGLASDKFVFPMAEATGNI